LTPEPDSRSAFEASEDHHGLPTTSYYRNQFWVIDPRGPIFQCSGIHGQTVFVHGPSKVVIAKFSTWPDAWTESFAGMTRLGLTSLAEQIGAG
jgi:CubicO group peptidase (beta-lactamase class C family)